MVYVMMKSALLASLPAVLALAIAQPAAAQNPGRYSAPPAVALSPDLASPWVLQLSRKPQGNGRYSVEVSRPRHAPAAAPRVRQPFGAHGVTTHAREQFHRAAPVARQAPLPVSTPEKKRARDEFDPRFEMQVVEYASDLEPGSIVIDTSQRFLYLIEGNGLARRSGVGVGREGFEWSGSNRISRKAEWPGWTPPPEMIARERKRGKILPSHMPGGPENPLGARALYLGDTLYRIHGTNQPWTIGRAMSSGCIRMRNEDVIDLYERVKIGAKVVVS